MNRTLVVASLIAMVTAGIHVFMGGVSVAEPLLASALEIRPKLILYAVWHMASVALVLSALALFVASLQRQADAMRSLVRFISLLWCAFGLVFLAIVATAPDKGWLFQLPQWALLLPVGLLGFCGSLGRSRRSNNEF